MNKHSYKLVFSKKHGMLVAASEIAQNHSKEPSSGICGDSEPSGRAVRIKQGLALLLMAFQVWQPLLADPVAITPDSAAQGNKPVVTAAGNGVPVVQIVAPNNQGVSLNQFKDYNVPTVGLILNNSGQMTQTQLGGYIPGNPQLGNAAASTIVNQVNGNNPSQILGWQEIAGNKANLVISNPNGISINGAGFINTQNLTLTTGKPQLNNGALSGYNVQAGQISVGEQGLNASDLDKLSILARSVQLNGQIWAKQADVITGANTINADGSHTAQTADANKPNYALDVAALGGMYAQQIRMIGTEQGLGVNNAGKLIAQDQLSLDNQGNLINSGQINSGNQSTLKVHATDNSGQISALNNLKLTSTQSVTNSGKITAGSVQLDGQSLNNTGQIQQTGDQSMRLSATTLNNAGTLGIVKADTTPTVDPSTGTVQVENSTAPAETTGASSTDSTTTTTADPVALDAGHIQVAQGIDNSGQILSSGAIIADISDSLTNSGTIRTAQNLTANTHTLSNSGIIAGQSGVQLNTQQLSNSGQMTGQNLSTQANSLRNSGQIQGDILTLKADGSLDNTHGSIQSEQLSLTTPQLNNTQGLINTGEGNLTLINDELNNTAGYILSKQLTLNNQTLNNTSGVMGAQSIQIASQDVNNDQGLIQAENAQINTQKLTNTNNLDKGIIGTNSVTVQADHLNNTQGRIAAGNHNQVTVAQDLTNSSGQIVSDKAVTLSADTLSNQGGLIQANDLSINTRTLSNSQSGENGGIIGVNDLKLTATETLNNTAVGKILSGNTATIKTAALSNVDNSLIQAKTLDVTAKTIDNSNTYSATSIGGLIGTNTLSVNADSVNNTSGYIAGGVLALQTPTLLNKQGLIVTDGDLSLTQSVLDNQAGGISARNLSIDSTQVNNQGGRLLAAQALNAQADQINNQGGTLSAGEQMIVQGGVLNNQAGLIQGKNTSITSTRIDNQNTLNANNSQGIFATEALTVNSTDLLNQSGRMAGGSLTTTTQNLDNTGGAIQAQNTLNITGSTTLNNTQGILVAGGQTSVHAGQLNNTQGQIASNSALSVQATSATNASGKILSDQALTLTADQLTNQSGLIQGASLTLDAQQLVNTASGTTGGLIASQGALKVNADTIDNHTGYMAGQTANLIGQSIDNQSGQITGVDALSISTSGLNNNAGKVQSSGALNVDAHSGALTNQQGLISSAAHADIKTGSLDNIGGQVLAAQTATVQANLVQNEQGLIRANDLTVTAPTIHNTHSGDTGGIVGDTRLSVTANTQLDNQAGYLAGGTTQVHTADLSNQQGQVIGTTDLAVDATQLNNSTGTIAGNAHVSVSGQTLNNQSGIVSAQKDLTVSVGQINNTQGTLLAKANQTITADQLLNSAGWVQAQQLNIAATSITNDNQTLNNALVKGTLLGNETLTIQNNTLLNNTGWIQAGDDTHTGSANITSTTLNNSGTVQSGNLNLNSTTLNNQAGQLIANQDLGINATTLNNQQGLVYAVGKATLNAGNIDNSNTKGSEQTGIQANSVLVQGNNTFNNTNGQVIGNTVDLTSQDLNNTSGRVSGNDVTVNATHLTNATGELLANNQLTLTTQNYTHQGTIQGNNGTTLNLSGDFTNQGTLSSSGSLGIHTDGNMTNTSGSTMSSGNTLSLSGQNITNQTDATIKAVHTQLTANDTILNDGTIDGSLTELRAGNQIINNHKIYGGDFEGNGGVLIGTNNLINNENAVIASRSQMNIGAHSITNNLNGLIQTQGDLSIGRDLGTQAQNYAVTGLADSLTNNSATIEVGGNAQWGVAETINKNTQFAVQAEGQINAQNVNYAVIDGYQYDTGATVYLAYNLNAYKTFFYSSEQLGSGLTLEAAREQFKNSSYYNPLMDIFINLRKFAVITSNLFPASQFSPSDLSKPNHQVKDFLDDNASIIIREFNSDSIKSISYNFLNVVPSENVDPNSGKNPFVGNVLQQTNTYNTSDAIKQYMLDKYGWKLYSSMSDLYKAEFEFIELAYNPSRYYQAKWSAQDTHTNYYAGAVYSGLLPESFTYNKGDSIWAKFGIAEPNTAIPFVRQKPTINALCQANPSWSSCADVYQQLAQYNAELAQFNIWADQNRDKYIELNRKIIAFNDDWNANVHINFTSFNGIATTTTPIVTSSSPSKIIIGGDMNLSGHITNDKSQIVVGGALLGNSTGITNDNTGATVQVVTNYNGTLTEVKNAQVNATTQANPAPTIQTVNLSVAEVKTNVGAQNIATVASALNTGVNSVTTSGQANLNNTAATGKDSAATSLISGTGINGAQLSAQTGANVGSISTGQTIDGGGVQSQTGNPTGSPVSSVPAGEGKEIRTVAFNGILPSNLLFNVSKDPNDAYVVETDPQFTDKKQFLGSSYMLGQYDPNKQYKRMGDGLYEQKLITEQIITATGKRFIGDYSSNEAQYKALMDNGLAVGKQFNLSVGTALTAEQMAKLTTDIVWMVEETVTLADGTRVKALVPKVYLSTNTLDLKGDGTLIASKNNFLNVTGNVTNTGGTIAAFNTMDMKANSITNQGGIIGGNKGSDITLRTTGDLNNIGGTLRGGNLALDVGGNLNSQTTTYHTQTGDMNVKDRRGYASVRDGIDQIASIQALDSNRTKTYTDTDGKEQSDTQTALNIQTKGDINLKATQIDSAGSSYIAGQNINLTTVNTGFAENAVYNWSGKNKHRTERSDTTEVGTSISTKGDNTLVADNGLNIRAGNLITDKDLTLSANAINMTEGRKTHTDYRDEYVKDSDFLSSSTSHSIDSNYANTSVGSQLIGDTVTTLSKGDTNVRGSTIFGTNGVDMISTDGNININAAEDRFNQYDYRKITESGLGALGGLSFGTMSNEQGRTGDQIGHTGSTVASTNGDINLSAQQGNIQLQASKLDSLNGDITAQAQRIDLTDVHNTATQDQYTKYKSAGLSVSASVAGVSAVQNVAQSADLLGQASNGSQSGAAAVSTAFAAYNAYRGVKDLATGIGKLGSAASATDVAGALGASVSISLGVQKSESKSHSEQATSVGSSITTNGSVNLIASGAGKDSDINLTNATVVGQSGTHLNAEGDIHAQPGVNSASMNSSNKSSGGSIGVSFGSSGFSLNLSVNGAKGKANGSDTSYSETVIGSGNSTTTLTSGGDTTLNGAIVKGQHVAADIGGNLTIETPQDTSTYDSKQTSYGAGVSIPLGAGAFSVSGSFDASKVNSNYASVQEQSGIFAGSGGYDVKVNGHTQLEGGLITSSQIAEDKGLNQFSTGTLAVHDIQNRADYDGQAIGVKGGITVGGEGSAKPDKKGNPTGVFGTDRALGVSKAVGYGSASGEEQSVTRSGINTGNITITNAEAQSASGVSVDAVKAQVKTEVSTENAIANSNSLQNQFNADQIQASLNAQVKITQKFDEDRQQVKTFINQEIANAQAVLNSGTATSQEIEKARQTIDNWQKAGVFVDVVAGALTGPTSTGSVGTIANAAAPALQYAVGQYFKSNELKNALDGGNRSTEGSPLHIAAHTFLAAAVAAAGGNDAVLAGVSTGMGEVLTPVVAQWLYGNGDKDFKLSDMTPEQKETVSNIISLGAAGFTATAGGGMSDVATGAQLAQTAVEDNTLSQDQWVTYVEYKKRCWQGSDRFCTMADDMENILAKSNDKNIQKLVTIVQNRSRALTEDEWKFLLTMQKADANSSDSSRFMFMLMSGLTTEQKDELKDAAWEIYSNNDSSRYLTWLRNNHQLRNQPQRTYTIGGGGSFSPIVGGTGSIGLFRTVPGTDANGMPIKNQGDFGAFVTGGAVYGPDIGASVAIGANRGDARSTRGGTSVGMSLPTGAISVSGEIQTDERGNITSGSLGLGGRLPIPAPVGNVKQQWGCSVGFKSGYGCGD